jgi:hypothetical protein
VGRRFTPLLADWFGSKVNGTAQGLEKFCLGNFICNVAMHSFLHVPYSHLTCKMEATLPSF